MSAAEEIKKLADEAVTAGGVAALSSCAKLARGMADIYLQYGKVGEARGAREVANAIDDMQKRVE